MIPSPSPLTPRSVNRVTLPTIERNAPFKSSDKHRFTHQDTENIPLSSPNGPPSSPFVENVESPPVKSFQNSSQQIVLQKEHPDRHHVELTEDALRENEGLMRAVQVMEDKMEKTKDYTVDDDTMSNAGEAPGYAGMDDTAFSAFSAVPNADMTRFARLGQSPAKNMPSSPTSHREEPTPRPSRHTPSRIRHFDDCYSSPTPRRHQREMSSHDDDSTNLLVDFTGQFNAIAPVSECSPTKNGRLSPNKYHNDLASYAAGKRTPSPAKHALPPSTPSESRNLANLLDFDLPPAPTPRSMPSISARELESMKSAFQSQISSLKAELSGREAEAGSLKNAMGDAERRVGEAQEQVREERGLKEGLQAEKSEWEKREQEMKDVLRSVKEEIIHSDREKNRLMQRATEADFRREEAEAKAMEAQSKGAGLQAGTSSSMTTPSQNGTPNTSSEVEAAVTKVAKELHGLYKSKHETKVTALKKSYSDRWEKKIKDLQIKVDDLSKENEELRIGRDATMTGVDPAKLEIANSSCDIERQQKQSEEHEKQQEEYQRRLSTQTTQLETLERDISTLRFNLTASEINNTELQSQLDASRAETTELIAATEELMTLSSSSTSHSEMQQQPTQPDPPRSTFSRSTSGNGSGLKAPGFGGYPSGSGSGESRIGGIRAPHAGYGYGSRERSGSGPKSGLMGSIERMGRGGAGGGH